MPYQVANTFRNLTPIGEGLQNITRAMFGGPTEGEIADRHALAEDRRAQAELRRQQIEESRARVAAAQAKRAADERAAADMQAAPQRIASWMLGGDQVAQDFMAHRRGDRVDAPFGTGMTGGLDEQDVPQVKMAAPMPQGLDQNAVARLSRVLTGVEAAKAIPGNDNVQHLAKVIAGLYDDEIRQRGATGALTPEQAAGVGRASAAVAGKPIFNNMGDSGVFDLFGGAQTLNPIGDAEVKLKGAKTKTEDTKQKENLAQAGAASASAADARKRTELRGDMTEWTDPNTNITYRLPAAEAARILMGGEVKKDVADNAAALRPAPTARMGAAGPRKMTANDTKLLRDELVGLLGTLDADKADGATKKAILVEAERQWQAGAAGHAEAVKRAIDAVAPQGFERSGVIGFRRDSPVGDARQTAPTGAPIPLGLQPASSPSGATVPPPPQRVRGQTYQTPRGPMRWTGTGWVPAAPARPGEVDS